MTQAQPHNETLGRLDDAEYLIIEADRRLSVATPQNPIKKGYIKGTYAYGGKWSYTFKPTTCISYFSDGLQVITFWSSLTSSCSAQISRPMTNQMDLTATCGDICRSASEIRP